MKPFFKWLFIIIAFTVIAGLLSLLILPMPQVNAKKAQLFETTISNSLEVSGLVSSDHTYRLRATISGEVSGLSLALGDTVINGSVLAVIKPKITPPVVVNDSQEEATLNNLISESELAITQASNEYQRVSAAVNAGVVPRFKLDEINASLDRAKNQKASAIRRLNGYRKDKRDRKNNTPTPQQTIKALSNGIVVDKHTLNGQNILPGDSLVSIVSTDDLSIRAMMQPSEARELNLGQTVQVSQPGTQKRWTEKVVKISPLIETEGSDRGLQKITLSLANSLRPQSTINEKLLLKIGADTLQRSTTLPIEAVVRKGKGYQAFVIEQNKPLSLSQVYSRQGLFEALKHIKCNLINCRIASFNVQAQAITLGKSDINNIQVLSPISDGLLVVIPDFKPNNNSVVSLSLR